MLELVVLVVRTRGGSQEGKEGEGEGSKTFGSRRPFSHGPGAPAAELRAHHDNWVGGRRLPQATH